jgi:hypothetical protein
MTDRDYDVLVVGELNADLILRGDVTPAFGQVEKLIDDAALTIAVRRMICARRGWGCAGVHACATICRFRRANQSAWQRRRRRVIDRASYRPRRHLSRLSDRGDSHSLARSPLRLMIDLSWLAAGRGIPSGQPSARPLRPDAPRRFGRAKARRLTISIDTNYDPRKWEADCAKLCSASMLPAERMELLAITHEAD